jgi:uncharacterized protein
VSDILTSSPYREEASAAITAPLPFAASSPAIAPQRDTEVLPQPVSQQERIPTIDVVRGFALLGILLMNIASFAGPQDLYVNPLITGTHRTWNLAAWSIRWILFEGKMRAAFSLLFGAGVILLTERAERRGSRNVADVFLRRNMWLTLFGVLHFYLVWIGDILYSYGLTALLFLFPCRKLAWRHLLIAGVAVLALGTGYDTYSSLNDVRDRKAGEAAQALVSQGKKLTSAQQDDLKKWNDTQDRHKKFRADDLKAMRGSYLDQIKWRAGLGPRIQAEYYYTFGFTDTLAMMLLGMGLYRMGFLTGNLGYRVYAWTIAIGFLLSLPINGFETAGLIRDNFEDSGWWAFYQAGRVTGAVANVAVIVLIAKAGALPWITRRLAAVGQTALSNYLFTSIGCTIFFCAFGLYGRLEYYQIYAVVACVWFVNLTLSPIWLRHYQFGPAEWVWRSLTYWKRQPMRRGAVAEDAALIIA